MPTSTNTRPFHRARLARVAALAVACLVAITGVVASSASAGAVKGSLAVISVNDVGTGLAGAVTGRPMSVVVEARDASGAPLVVNRDTGVRLGSTGGPGSLSGTVTGTIAKNTARATITGALYSAFANGVTLTVTTTSGVTLDPATVTVNVAHSAVKVASSPHQALDVTDPGCPGPTTDLPVCGFLLLDNGGNGDVLMSVGSCNQILSCRTSGGTTAELVTATVNLKDASGNPLYTHADPATLILACDKSLCANGGVGQFPVTVDLSDTGAFTTLAPCPAKGVLGADQDACVDQVQSTKDNAGDVYTYILFVHDIRGSYP